MKNLYETFDALLKTCDYVEDKLAYELFFQVR